MSLVGHIISQALLLGIPISIVTWFAFDRLFARGTLDRNEDPESLRVAAKTWVKDDKNNDAKSFLERRWMKFGGGGYGIAALWTFFCIELSDLWQFLTEGPPLNVLLEAGIVSFVIEFLINQFVNFVTALVWFAWWGDSYGVLAAFFIAWLGYISGVKASRHRSIPETLASVRDHARGRRA